MFYTIFLLITGKRETGFLTCKDGMLAFKTMTDKHLEILSVHSSSEDPCVFE